MTKKEAKDILLRFVEESKYRSDRKYGGLVQAISTYLEPVDEERLDEFAKEHVEEEQKYIRDVNAKVFNAFRAGYHKAKEE